MNKIILAIFTLALFSQQASSATLNELINKNIGDATQSFDKMRTTALQPASAVQLWVHVRGDSQIALAQEILAQVAKTTFKQQIVEQKPIQKVEAVPPKSQLRYFKKQNQAQAQELFDMLRQLIPELELSDVSSKYEKAGWIRSGHFELWLAPDLTKLQSQP
ncbi:MAG: hypothetical protein PHU06_07270 [Gallionella sp.]|nr:hypothetical protein [Gallionella sp.]MDD4958474.1 hypothetical protein [Gallionella sp.]